jgi:SAM-dependent methyltransferase
MNILVGLTNFGTKNLPYLERVIQEYRSMPFQTDIVVFSDIPKHLGRDIQVVVGLPSRDPWSLGFAHRRLFVDRSKDYDLFIYSEDDTLITERNIRAFLEVTPLLRPTEVAGFLRYEVGNDGRRYCSTMHSHFHWEIDSVTTVAGHAFARFTNAHSASYVLNRDQLERAIASGGYAVHPHRGAYDLLCTAATDPYTQCGLTKTICILRIEDFLLHHLPNKYLGRMGVEMPEVYRQVCALRSMSFDRSISFKLFETVKPLSRDRWNKKYYEAADDELLGAIPKDTQTVLSVGCGWGHSEEALVQRGMEVTAIPLDPVIAESAKMRGIHTLAPNFTQAFDQLRGRKFDCILMSNVLQHIESPASLLLNIKEFLGDRGNVVGCVSNLNSLSSRKLLGREKCRLGSPGAFARVLLNRISPPMIRRWFRSSGLSVSRLWYGGLYVRGLKMIAYLLLPRAAAPSLYFAAQVKR